jgi:hypothetical protein
MLRTIWRNNDRYIAGYWEKFDNRYYVAGDSAHRDKDGYFWIMGRIDDVLNVAGHRLGTMEIESALVAHPRVAEAAVVGKPHEIKGEAVFAYVVTRGERRTGEAGSLTKELRDWVGQQLGPIAKPDEIRFADNLPKTRSGKIMRRLLKTIARGEEITQDVSTLENPAILDQLRGVESPGTAAPAARASAKATAPKPKAIARAAGKSGNGGKRAAPAKSKRTKRSTARSGAAKANTAKGTKRRSTAASGKGSNAARRRTASSARKTRRLVKKAVIVRAAAKRARARSAGRRRR